VNFFKSTAILAAISISTLSIADDKISGVYGSIGYNSFEQEESIIEDSDSWFGAIGYQIDESWSFELKYTDVAGIEHSSLTSMYRIFPKGEPTPFIKFGLGLYKPQNNKLHTRTRTTSILGLGIAIPLSTSVEFAMGIDAIYQHEFLPGKSSHVDASPYISFTYFMQNAKTKHVALPPSDLDSDGVIDEKDLCKTTPAGSVVNQDGCSSHVESITLNINFKTNSAVLPDSAMQQIKTVADFMKEHQGTTVALEGHTDSDGSTKHNQTLSTLRAQAVAKCLISLGISQSLVSSHGFGESKPIQSNKTSQGKKANRRVMAQIQTTVLL
jgi:outer membrane protein OmpA-like peptidoglycan-associated protein